jgi:hypothetical protein
MPMVERRVLKVFNLVGQFPPAAHKFQVSFFYIPGFRFLRSDLAFHRFYPEQFRSRGHERQRATFRLVLPALSKDEARRTSPSCRDYCGAN